MSIKNLIIIFLLYPSIVFSKNFCFSVSNSKRILMISSDKEYLFYYPLSNKIDLKLKNINVFDDGGESGNVTFSEVYYEILNGRRTGLYNFLTQNGRIEEASYLNFSSNKKIFFERILGSEIKDKKIASECY